jgi:hypothetical protein
MQPLLVTLNLFQDNTTSWPVILKQVQDDDTMICHQAKATVLVS